MPLATIVVNDVSTENTKANPIYIGMEATSGILQESYLNLNELILTF